MNAFISFTHYPWCEAGSFKKRTPSAVNYEEFQSHKPLGSRVCQVSELLTEPLSHFAIFFPPRKHKRKRLEDKLNESASWKVRDGFQGRPVFIFLLVFAVKGGH